MKKLMAVLLLVFPVTTLADYLDVIEFKLGETCTLEEYLEVVKDFNAWGEDHGYRAEVWAPLMRSTLDTYFWVGRSKDAETFGAAWDVWRDALSDTDSTPAKLQASMSDCETNLNRSGFDIYE